MQIDENCGKRKQEQAIEESPIFFFSNYEKILVRNKTMIQEHFL